MNPILYRRAKPSDTHSILDLINFYSAKGLMLPRPFSQVLGRIRDFAVAVEGGSPSPYLRGVAALHPVGEDLAEIRSLAVEEGHQGLGIGRKLVEFCLEDAREMELKRVFTLTYQTEFFSKMGFVKVERSALPQKIWGDCVHCAKFSDCDEVAMLLVLPKP